MQVLFEWDFNNHYNHSAVQIDDIINRNLREFAPGVEEKSFVGELLLIRMKRNFMYPTDTTMEFYSGLIWMAETLSHGSKA